MADFIKSDTELNSYMVFPRFLLETDINETAKIMYMVLLDRARISMTNSEWSDENGHVFIIYTIKKLAEKLKKSEMTVKASLSALEKAGLIVRMRQGSGKANRIYVKYQTDSILYHRQTENCLRDGQNSFPVTDRILSTNKNKRIKINESNRIRRYECSEEESL